MTIVMDEWMKAAMADDSLAAEVLCNMKHSGDKSQSTLPPPPLPPLLQSTAPSWAKRKPRTRPVVASGSAASVSATKRADEEAVVKDSARCSPTTPLSWNCAASPSATADGVDDSRSPTPPNAARSKATGTSDSVSTKRCKRKRTFAELQEEESSLIKEKIYLTKEIENINANYKAQRARNESLKRIKLDLGSITNKKPMNSDQPQQTVVPSGAVTEQTTVPSSAITEQTVVPSSAVTGATEDDTHRQAANSAASRTESTQRPFLLPDLNMTPPEVGPCAEVQCGTS